MISVNECRKTNNVFFRLTCWYAPAAEKFNIKVFRALCVHVVLCDGFN